MIAANFGAYSALYRQVTKYRYRVLQDFEIPLYNRPAGVGNWPMVFRLEEHHYTLLNSAWQRYWYGLNTSTNPIKDRQAFLAYTETSKAVTNGRGIMSINKTTGEATQIGRDYIHGTGVGLPLPAIATLIFGRNVLCGEETVLTTRQGALLAGTRVLKVETMRVPDSRVTYDSHPHLVHKANIITNASGPDGYPKVNPFPERGERQGFSVYIPVVSSRQVYYPLDRLEKLPMSAPLPNPYNPPFYN